MRSFVTRSAKDQSMCRQKIGAVCPSAVTPICAVLVWRACLCAKMIAKPYVRVVQTTSGSQAKQTSRAQRGSVMSTTSTHAVTRTPSNVHTCQSNVHAVKTGAQQKHQDSYHESWLQGMHNWEALIFDNIIVFRISLAMTRALE